MANLEVGKRYIVDHQRKGTFTIEVDDIIGNQVTGTIVAGKARYVSEPDREQGDRIQLFTDGRLCRFKKAN